MSLLDTLPDDMADGGEFAVEDNGLLQSAELPTDDAELAMLLAEVPDEQEGIRAAPVEAPPAVRAASEPPKAKRRRRPPKRAPDAPPLSRSEICKRAAETRWGIRTANASEGSGTAGHPQTPSAPAALEVPADQSQIMAQDTARDTSTALVCSLQKPIPAKITGEKERKVRRAMVHLSSYSSISKTLKMDRKTIQRKMRLQAAIIYFAAYQRSWSTVMATYYFLQSRYADFKAVLHLCKQSFDEMQISLRVSEVPSDIPLWVAASQKREVITAKLEQINTKHIFLFRANNVHFSLETNPPTILQPIESTHGACIATVCAAQERGNAWAEQNFEGRGRMTVADNHGSNGLSDYYKFMQDWVRALLRWLCQIHSGHRICELQWATFPSELRGVMAGTLLLRYPGVFSKWKMDAKVWIRAKAKRRLKSEAPPLTEEAQAYRTSLFSSYLHANDERLAGPKAKQRRIRVFRKKKLNSGDPRKLDEVDHLCDGAECCADESATIKSLEDDIDAETSPDVWAENRWIGSEDSLDFHAFWLSCHAIYIAGYLIGIRGMQDLVEVQRLIFQLVQCDIAESIAEARPLTIARRR